MKKSWILLVSLCLTAGLIGCGSSSGDNPVDEGGDKGGDKNPPVTQNIDELVASGAPIEQILAAKYNSVNLVCKLWVTRNRTLVALDEPDQSFTWDLINDMSGDKVFVMENERRRHKTRVRIKIRRVDLSTTNYEDIVTGKVHNLVHSPIVRYRAKTVSQTRVQGVPVRSEQVDRGMLVEEVESGIVNRQLRVNPNRSHYEYVECKLNADLKPEYADHKKIQKYIPGSQNIINL